MFSLCRRIGAKFVGRFCLILGLVLVCVCTPVYANGFSVSAAADSTSGDYGGRAATNIWYVPFTARYDKGRASFRVIVPYVDITGPGNVLGPGIGGIDGRGIIVGGGNPGSGSMVVCDESVAGCALRNFDRESTDPVNSEDKGGDSAGVGTGDVKLQGASDLGLIGGIPFGGSSFSRVSQSGLGDVISAFSYTMIDHAPSGIAFDVTARLKIPTASADKHLGSGQFDYAVQGDLYKNFAKYTLVATFGYRILGSPSVITFHNVFYGAASVGYRLSSAVAVGATYTMAQSPVRLQDSRDVTLYLSQRVTNHFRLNVYGLRGFSERSPDWGGGINFRYIF